MKKKNTRIRCTLVEQKMTAPIDGFTALQLYSRRNLMGCASHCHQFAGPQSHLETGVFDGIEAKFRWFPVLRSHNDHRPITFQALSETKAHSTLDPKSRSVLSKVKGFMVLTTIGRQQSLLGSVSCGMHAHHRTDANSGTICIKAGYQVMTFPSPSNLLSSHGLYPTTK